MKQSYFPKPLKQRSPRGFGFANCFQSMVLHTVPSRSTNRTNQEMMLHFMKQWHCTAFSVGLSLVGHLPTLTNLSKRCGVLAKVILVQCVVVTRVAQVGLLNTQHITSDTQMSWTAHQFLWQDVIAIFELASSHLSSTSHVSQWMSVYMYVCIYVYIYHIRLILVLPGGPQKPWVGDIWLSLPHRFGGSKSEAPAPWNVRLKTSMLMMFVGVRKSSWSSRGMSVCRYLLLFRHIA